jgi:hypothetical protein
LHLLNPS